MPIGLLIIIYCEFDYCRAPRQRRGAEGNTGCSGNSPYIIVNPELFIDILSY